MKAGLARAVARVQIAIGIVIILIGAGVAIGTFVAWPEVTRSISRSMSPRAELAARIVGPAAVFVAGVILGAPFVVVGELILISLDMRRRLARIDRRLRRWEEASGPQGESSWFDRVRRR